MFNNVNQTYNQQDATLEIVIMLAGAFLLGCLLCWLIRKLIGINKQEQELATNMPSKRVKNHTNISTPPQTLTGKDRVTEEAAPKVSVPTHYSTPRIDDLTKISGINVDTENELRSRGINSYIDLRDIHKQSIIDTLETTSGKSISSIEAQTWPHQASLAAKGEWEKLHEYQNFMERTKKAAEKIKQEAEQEKSSDLTKLPTDDLKMIEGIGPKIEELLNKNGINSFKDLRKSDRDTLKSYLDNAGSRFKMHEPESWPHQAGMAERGEWEELKIYQEFMDGGREIPSNSASTKIDIPAQPIINDEAEHKHKLIQDDLKKIEGIGPKIEEILNKEGITTFAKLHETDRDTLKSYLDKAGNQFKMHEPESWPHQAGMAATGQWEELRIYQEFMDGGREVPSGSASSQLKEPIASLHIKDTTENNFDDLKKIEGIGPKIQELLNKAGIKTYQDLSHSNRETLKKLLDDAGPAYRMHEPETWPAQAKMAFNNQWDKLEKYQEEIINERAK